jgi:hypothetical protein
MKTVDSSDPLHDVLARFPGSKSTIRVLFETEEQFRELCGDYAQCVAMLQRLRTQRESQDDRIEQYAEMRECLERELRERIGGSCRDWTSHRNS